MNIGRVDSALRGVLWLSVGFYALLIIHEFAGYIDTYPYFALDDSLANISYSLASEGRYGFLSSPFQAPTHALRHDGFFNYGPWYFYFGSILIWLFGYSIGLLRAIHLVALIITIVVAARWFKNKEGAIAAALYSLAVLMLFDTAHWPMVRPDIMVSLMAVLFVAFSGIAIKHNKAVFWFLAGLAAACSSFTHLIAWSVVFACAMVFFASQILEKQKGSDWFKKAMVNLFAVASGGFAGALMFFASFDFRFKEFISYIAGYNKFLGDMQPKGGYAGVLATHWSSAFGAFPYNSRTTWVFALIVVGILITIIAIFRGISSRKEILAYLFPPITVFILYAASLGRYANYHSGYVILLQVMALWSAGACVYILMRLMNIKFERVGAAISYVVIIMLIILVCNVSYKKTNTLSPRAEQLNQWVSISEYVNEMLTPLPAGARAWGTVMYGIENPTRIQLIQFGEGLYATASLSAAQKKALAPEYIVWGYPENRDNAVATLRGTTSSFDEFAHALPESQYTPVSMVYGKPYGVTRVYQRIDSFSDPTVIRPMISSYNPSTKQWTRMAGLPLSLKFNVVKPAQIKLGYSADVPEKAADQTVSATAEAGDYLIRVGIDQSSRQGGMGGIVSVASTHALSEVMSELGPSTDFAPYWSTDKESFLFHRHSGGDIFLSVCDLNHDAIMGGIDVYPLVPLKKFNEERSRFSLPTLTDWHPSTGIVVDTKEEAKLVVRGDNSQFGYQISSPVIEVEPNSLVTLRLPVTAEKGQVGIGVLEKSGQTWLVAPDSVKREIVFNTGNNTGFIVVVANYFPQPSATEPSRFTILKGAYSTMSRQEYYTDLLVKSRTSLGDKKR